MKTTRILIAIFVVLFASPVNAQKKKGAEKPKTEKKVEKSQPSPGDLLFENMLESTQCVFFIDSIVADRSSFLQHIPLPSECGTISTYDDFFQTEGHEGSYVFVNEFGNKAYYSLVDDTGKSQLFTMDLLGNKWSKPAAVEGITGGSSPNYPFMMADGTTFYFAQKGNNAIGGYDIFVTRYDSDTGEFLRPNNLGLPFNSKANDYFYMESELDSLGWFVTDRNQPEGKVCIYTFVPSKNRTNVDLSELPESEVRQLADIHDIRSTWPSEEAHQMAMNRLSSMRERVSMASTIASGGAQGFVINDRSVYASASDFRSQQARETYSELLQMRQLSERETLKLERLRSTYYDASDEERSQLAATILKSEKELERLNLSIIETEKRVRNMENQHLSKP